MALDQRVPTPESEKPNLTRQHLNGFKTKIDTKDFMQFMPGCVIKVQNADDWPPADSSQIGVIWAMPHYTTDSVKKETIMASDDSNKYIPLLRGINDMPAVGEMVLLTKISGTQFYLGPLNINQTPNRGLDPFRANQTTSGKEQGSLSDTANNPGLMPIDYRHLGKRINSKLDNPTLFNKQIMFGETGEEQEEGLGIPQISPAQLNIKGDMVIEGKYGNSIRFGHRNVFPHVILSNGRSVRNICETTLDSSLIFMSKRGSIRDHFNEDTLLVRDRESQGDQLPEPKLYDYQWTLADQTPFHLKLEDACYIAKTLQSSMGRGLGPHKDDVEGATGEDDPNIDDTIYEYAGPQILTSSDRITLNAKKESLFLAAANFINIGAQNNINISTSKTMLTNASTSVRFNTPLFQVHAPGKVYIDGRKNTNDDDEIVGSIFLGNPVLGDKMSPAVLGDGLAAWLVMLISEIKQLCMDVSFSVENRANSGGSYDIMSVRAEALDDLMGLIEKENPENGQTFMWPEQMAKIILSDSVKLKK